MTFFVISLTQLDALDRSDFLIVNLSRVALRTSPSASLTAVFLVLFSSLFREASHAFLAPGKPFLGADLFLVDDAIGFCSNLLSEFSGVASLSRFG